MRLRRINNVNRRTLKTKRGGFGKVLTHGLNGADCPYVGKPWNGIGPRVGSFSKGPVYPYHDSNYYALSKYGVTPGGVNLLFGDKSVRNYKGGRKTSRRRKLTKRNKRNKRNKSNKRNKRNKSNKSLGVKKGGFKLTDFVPNVVLNITRPIQTALYNSAPLVGRQWRGLTKKVSPLPTIQPKLQGTHKTTAAGNPVKIKQVNIKAIREDAINYVKNLQ